jgi:hypothetical protein
MFSNIEQAGLVFGAAAEVYGRMVNEIAPRLLLETYHFEDVSEFERKGSNPTYGRSYLGKTYWRETLSRAHMASVASILRTTRWVDAAVREYRAGSLFGWASACRSLLEAAGDSGHSLGAVPLTLAHLHRKIQVEINGQGFGPPMVSRELEDALIHFTHARKLKKGDPAPESHRARQSWEYVKFIEDMNINGAKELYAYLCELVHPAAESVSTMFVLQEGGWTVSLKNEQAVLEIKRCENRNLLSNVLMAAYNPPFMTLKVLHKFGVFAQINELRKYDFSNIPLWQKSEVALRS